MIVLQKESRKKDACITAMNIVINRKKKQNFEGRLPIRKEYIN